MTVDLPPAYTDLDTDFDGQVGLYEWIVARRNELDLFESIDGDADGILTPREFIVHDELGSDGDAILTSFKEKYERPRVTIVGGPMATSSGKGSTKTKYLSEEVKERHAGFATKMAFPYIDQNKDGKITVEEMKRDEKTRRVIGMFEKANIKVETMTQQEFTQRYVQAMDTFEGMKQKGGDGGREEGRGRDGRGRR